MNRIPKHTSKNESLRIIESLYVIMTEKLLDRVIEVTQLNDDCANAIRIVMFKHTGSVRAEDFW